MASGGTMAHKILMGPPQTGQSKTSTNTHFKSSAHVKRRGWIPLWQLESFVAETLFLS
jgi:hypothetical protein